MQSLCGTDCCSRCAHRAECGGCQNGHPFDGDCIAAECIRQDGQDGFLCFKEFLISEINALGIKGLVVNNLNLLNGFFVNLEYRLANGQTVKLLKDNNVYLGATKSRYPARKDAMGLLPIKITYLSVNMDVMEQIRK